jgi:hypothetical protein
MVIVVGVMMPVMMPLMMPLMVGGVLPVAAVAADPRNVAESPGNLRLAQHRCGPTKGEHRQQSTKEVTPRGPMAQTLGETIKLHVIHGDSSGQPQEGLAGRFPPGLPVAVRRSPHG